MIEEEWFLRPAVFMIKGIIFDFDGVITDSEPPYIEALIKYLHGFGIDAAFEELQHVIGKTVDAIATEVIEKYGLQTTIEEFNTESMRIYEEDNDIRKFKPMSGLYEFLDRCKKRGIRMCIASSSELNYLYNIMDSLKIRDYFEYVISGDGLPRSKPDPLIYNLAAEKMKLDKKDLMIIEDSYNGIMAGKASGIFTVGLKASRVIQDTSMADKEVYSFQEIEL